MKSWDSNMNHTHHSYIDVATGCSMDSMNSGPIAQKLLLIFVNLSLARWRHFNQQQQQTRLRPFLHVSNSIFIYFVQKKQWHNTKVAKEQDNKAYSMR